MSYWVYWPQIPGKLISPATFGKQKRRNLIFDNSTLQVAAKQVNFTNYFENNLPNIINIHIQIRNIPPFAP